LSFDISLRCQEGTDSNQLEQRGLKRATSKSDYQGDEGSSLSQKDINWHHKALALKNSKNTIQLYSSVV